MSKRCGILLPVFSLPGTYGIGCFSKEAYDFIDFLRAAGQSYWQVLPIGPIGPGASPYQSVSTFAIEPLFIDLEQLVDEGLLEWPDLLALEEALQGKKDELIDYDSLNRLKMPLLEVAHQKFLNKKDDKGYEKFCKEQKDWLMPYASFMGDTDFFCFLQYKAYSQWQMLKRYANANGIQIIGDLPIYVAPDGTDVSFDAKLFLLDKKGRSVFVAGCPPDAYAPEGQRWGNPVYDWGYHKRTNYAWWIKRMKCAMELFDVVRLDHFRGFEAYYSIPAESPNAINGEWEKGPGMDLFRAMETALGPLPVIAEDLGFLTPKVEALIAESGFPGMKVLQFAFDGDPHNDYLPHLYPKNSVAYTGTHDNATTLGWLKELSDAEKEHIYRYFNLKSTVSNEELVDILVASVLVSDAKLVIIPIQDYLHLDNAGRINTPSTVGNNWQWRLKKEEVGPALSEYIRQFAKVTNR